MIHRISALYRRLRIDLAGVSAVEFALIAPLMIAIYLGATELSFMLMSDRRVTATASTLGDLTARETSLNNCDIQDIFAASSILMQPDDSTTVRMRITSIRNTSGSLSVDWSDAIGPLNADTTPSIEPMTTAEAQTMTVPAGLIPDGMTIILAETSFPYEGVFGAIDGLISSGTLEDQFYIRPRRVNAIFRDNSTMTCS